MTGEERPLVRPVHVGRTREGTPFRAVILASGARPGAHGLWIVA